MKLADAAEQIGTHEFPATSEEVIEQFGDLELTHPNGTETLGEALGRLGTETFETAEEAQFATYSAVSSDAIGRKHYSERDAAVPGEDGHDPLSF